MKIGMIGMGFVGGTTAKVLSQAHEILPYDRFKEPYTSQEKLYDMAQLSDVVFLCVPTPMKPSGEIDTEPMHYSLSNLSNAVSRISRNYEDILVTVRSTAVSGTTDSFAKQYPFKFAFNPEFLVEKNAEEDMRNTDRIVLGVEDKQSETLLRQVYEPLFPNAKYIITNRRTAEMIKYGANATLAAQVMIANELYSICDALEINYNTVKDAIQLDSRIGRNMDVPGPDGHRGFGGKCFPKDLAALIYLARENRVRPRVFEEVERSNLDVRKIKDWEDIPGATSEKGFAD